MAPTAHDELNGQFIKHWENKIAKKMRSIYIYIYKFVQNSLPGVYRKLLS